MDPVLAIVLIVVIAVAVGVAAFFGGIITVRRSVRKKSARLKRKPKGLLKRQSVRQRLPKKKLSLRERTKHTDFLPRQKRKYPTDAEIFSVRKDVYSKRKKPWKRSWTALKKKKRLLHRKTRLPRADLLRPKKSSRANLKCLKKFPVLRPNRLRLISLIILTVN